MEQNIKDALVAGLGVDIVEVDHMEAVIARSPKFVEKVYTPAEQEYCEGRGVPTIHYATHFAAKEAVLKALGTGFSEGIGPKDVEVAHDEKGRPLAVLHGKAAQIAAEQGILEMHLSLSRTKTAAVANAIAVNEAAQVKEPEVKPSAKEELAAAFKELRGMLDELEAYKRGEADEDSTAQEQPAEEQHAQDE